MSFTPGRLVLEAHTYSIGPGAAHSVKRQVNHNADRTVTTAIFDVLYRMFEDGLKEDVREALHATETEEPDPRLFIDLFNHLKLV